MMAGAVRALVLALLVALTDTHVSATQPSTLASPACFPRAQLVNPVRGDYGVRLALRLRGGRAVSDKKEGARGLTSVGEGGDATSDATERPVRPLPDVGEAMQAKIIKHRQMRKGKVPDDPAEAQAKLERKKKHDQRRERRDAHRVLVKKLKPKDHPRRPFMREREGGRKNVKERPSPGKARGASTDGPDGKSGATGRTTPAEKDAAWAREAALAFRNSAREGGGNVAAKKKLAVPMPARERILRPFWDPQAKGREIGSPSLVKRRRSREQLLHALIAVQSEHERNSSSAGLVHDELHYALTRLVRGLASDTAGDAFSETLVAVLQSFGPGSVRGGHMGLLTANDIFVLLDRCLDDGPGAGGGGKGEALSAKEVFLLHCVRLYSPLYCAQQTIGVVVYVFLRPRQICIYVYI